MEEYSYTSTHPLGHTGPVTESLYITFNTTTTPIATTTTITIASIRLYAINSKHRVVAEGITNYVNNHYWRPTRFHTVTV